VTGYVCFYETGNYAEALLLYNEGLEMTRKVCRADHPSIAVTLRNIAQVYERQGTRENLSVRSRAYNHLLSCVQASAWRPSRSTARP
jgi:hypothetical protein